MKLFPHSTDYVASLLEQSEPLLSDQSGTRDRRTFLKEALALLTLSGAVSCSSSSSGGVGPAPMISFTPASTPVVRRSARQLYSEVNVVTSMMLPSNNRLRLMRSHPMKPRFITVHNTENPDAGAMQHGRALLNCALRNDWHYTVDQSMAVQHIPLTETGFHADSGGPGDRYSIGIEMCEKRGESLPRTFDRAAKLIAYQMKQWDIPLRNVVPHFYWTGKRCPHLLLDNGVPRAKWSWFISRVDYYHRCIA
jgi:N-acetylmuramoyl-L-alanine amidase